MSKGTTFSTQLRAGLQHQYEDSQTIWREGVRTKATQRLGTIKISVKLQALDSPTKQDGYLITICTYTKDANTKKGLEEYN